MLRYLRKIKKERSDQYQELSFSGKEQWTDIATAHAEFLLNSKKAALKEEIIKPKKVKKNAV